MTEEVLIEDKRKRVYVLYFKSNGEVFQKEEEYVIGIFTQELIVEAVTKKIRYSEMDYVILDGEDGVRPYVRPHLQRGVRRFKGSVGFG